MIDIKLIRENPDFVKKKLALRGARIDLDAIIKLDKEYRALLLRFEELRALKNKANAEVAKAKPAEKKKVIAKIREFDEDFDRLESESSALREKLAALLLQIPNLPANEAPAGKDEKSNTELKKVGKPKKFSFEPRDHVELGKILGAIDTERAGKVSGSRFGYLTGPGALLEFAILGYAMKELAGNGFTPVVPPVLIGEEAMAGMGYLEHGGNAETYHFEKDNLYLIGTSEQALGPMHMNEILDAKKLPLRYAGFSSCFRREAGAYGKDVRGILRVHQFDKIEMFSFALPEESKKEHEFLLGIQEKLMHGLGIPYRVMDLCTGDLGVPSSRTFDIESWIPSQKRYRETHSASNCTDFQARRLKIRVKKKNGGTELVHTLNGTAFAIGRIIIAILENFQEKNGTVTVPEALRPYMFGMKKIHAKKE